MATNDMLEHVLVPVATEADATETARALREYSPAQVTVTHVVEKGGGVPDKTPVEQSEAVAADAYDAVREWFPDAEEHTTYETDVVRGIFAAAREVEATAIAFQPRGGNRLAKFLAGDLTQKLVTNAPLPVLVLPQEGGRY
ncbi:Nucleotide-binding universal stress protein, UspA family [Halovenus aranensis]|uniref:Nucleotide-binding universal stress protein, UspA family n=1 Tax=Halovenus aranensis TaxID=890420 RepID=A0A1G8SNY3_9EURY|nr:universal stress protein [Halovenus aranensis]SDJ30901.1 Nucleotide-binding universal stress protein, UspA family [Halovenus aranensis]